MNEVPPDLFRSVCICLELQAGCAEGRECPLKKRKISEDAFDVEMDTEYADLEARCLLEILDEFGTEAKEEYRFCLIENSREDGGQYYQILMSQGREAAERYYLHLKAWQHRRILTGEDLN